MGRAPCCDKANVKKGPWSPEEDAKLKDFINKHGTGGNWIALPHKAGLKRCGKSCRLRWLNYLRPNIKHGEFSEDEDRIICSLYANIGSRWSIIAGQLPGRTDNDIKNYWNTKLRKKLLAMLPSFQKKPSLNFPSISPPFSDHHKSDNYNFNPNNSSSFYNYNNPNYIINNINSHLTTTTTTTTTSTTLIHDHINVTDLFSPPTTTTSNPNVNGVISNNNYNYLGFQDEYYYYYPEVKERMLMFGGGHPHHQIKQEEEFGVQGFEDQVHSLIMTDDEHKGYFKNHVIDVSPLHSDIEEVKQVIDMNNNSSSASMINVNINSYMHADE